MSAFAPHSATSAVKCQPPRRARRSQRALWTAPRPIHPRPTAQPHVSSKASHGPLQCVASVSPRTVPHAPERDCRQQLESREACAPRRQTIEAQEGGRRLLAAGTGRRRNNQCPPLTPARGLGRHPSLSLRQNSLHVPPSPSVRSPARDRARAKGGDNMRIRRGFSPGRSRNHPHAPHSLCPSLADLPASFPFRLLPFSNTSLQSCPSPALWKTKHGV